MHDLSLQSDSSPHITLCPHGCVHLQLGPVILLLNHESLRALAQAARECVQEVDRDPTWLDASVAESIN